jgi:hypothetical protein
MPWSDLSDGRTRAVCCSVLAGELIFVGEALIGEPIGVVEAESGDRLVRCAARSRCCAGNNSPTPPMKHDNIPL